MMRTTCCGDYAEACQIRSASQFYTYICATFYIAVTCFLPAMSLESSAAFLLAAPSSAT